MRRLNLILIFYLKVKSLNKRVSRFGNIFEIQYVRQVEVMCVDSISPTAFLINSGPRPTWTLLYAHTNDIHSLRMDAGNSVNNRFWKRVIKENRAIIANLQNKWKCKRTDSLFQYSGSVII